MIEIERKFLVTSLDFITEKSNSYTIKQGFLNTHPERTVRVRIKDKSAFLTIKGKPNASHRSRFEWEKQITVAEAENLLKLCERGVIDKTRYEVQSDSHTFEIDVFEGDNKGLTIAEVELSEENETFLKPDWLGEEVTGDTKYYNSQLSKTPFNTWIND
ncbi:CYTH domain-containing protein [Croceibacter atlanticus]|uniref:CYTH domain-containing protein n=1 Tax=Croceibacter atlanticus TaxID=313588 RepID=UPI000E840110|nr:adenylate cyclase [Flavobacteriaceae bacterium]|tara:strand:- start:43 stop:519 length:477 start_codon:yes stop_codon:yes gene_type:complete